VTINYDDMRDGLLDVMYDHIENNQPLNEAALDYILNLAFNDRAIYVECDDGERHIDHNCSSMRVVQMLPEWSVK